MNYVIIVLIAIVGIPLVAVLAGAGWSWGKIWTARKILRRQRRNDQ